MVIKRRITIEMGDGSFWERRDNGWSWERGTSNRKSNMSNPFYMFFHDITPVAEILNELARAMPKE